MEAVSFFWSITMFLLWIGLLFWLYNDAEANGYSGCLWMVLFFFFHIIALAVYLIFFHGVSAIRSPHRAVNRNDDLTYRSEYRASTSPPRKTYSSGQGWGNTVAPTSMGKADKFFRDETLDKLIAEDKLYEARVYLKDMISLAKEMDDQRGIANYKQYEKKLSQATNNFRQ